MPAAPPAKVDEGLQTLMDDVNPAIGDIVVRPEVAWQRPEP